MKLAERFVFSAAAALAIGAQAAAPSVSSVSITPTNTFASVVVDYTLEDAPAIVTFEVQTNSVPLDIGYPSAVGAVNRFLQPGNYRFTWAANVDWPGHVVSDPSVKIVVKAAPTNNPPDYMLISMKHADIPRRYYDKVEDVPGGITNYCYKTSWLAMRRIHAAGRTFRQGLMPGETGRNDANASRLVVFSEDYYIGVYELTTRQYINMVPSGTGWKTFCDAVYKNADDYAEMMGRSAYNEARALGGPTPRYYILGNSASFVWPESNYACSTSLGMYKFQQFTHCPKMYYPTSAQWEYACRAGSSTPFANGQTNIAGLGWCTENNTDDPEWKTDKPHAVGLLKPNAWGLYDMHGNVREWCCDIYPTIRETDTGGKALLDPSGPTYAESGYDLDTLKMVRHGGGFKNTGADCASGYMKTAGSGELLWNDGGTSNGFRLCCPAIVDR